MTVSPDLEALRSAFETDAGRPPTTNGVLVTWPSAPVEIVRATGLVPVILRAGPTPTPEADVSLEPGVFSARTRYLIDLALSGRLSAYAAIVVPRTSDEDYKAFLYLRELARTRRPTPRLPPVHLFDLLQSDTPGVREYDRLRTRALLDVLAGVSGRLPSSSELATAVGQANAARRAGRQLLDLRRGEPRVAGRTVLPLLGAFWQMNPDAYARHAARVAHTFSSGAPLTGPRLLVWGSAIDERDSIAALERSGAVVVAESSPWGSRAVGSDVDETIAALDALADKYRADTVGPRRPRARERAWLADAIAGGVDAVVAWIDENDAVYGWDYPDLRATLDHQGVPHVLVRGDSPVDLPADAAAFIARLTRSTREAARG